MDVLILMLVYAGFPRALINGLLTAKKYLQAWIDHDLDRREVRFFKVVC
ncbi:MAG: hypothetical protein ACM3TN_08585 [Alphaproteobacteria bacterium]